MWNTIKSIISETNGNLSTMRLLVTLVTLTFLFNWTYIIIKTGTWVALDYGSVVALLGSLSAKAYQKNFEEYKK